MAADGAWCRVMVVVVVVMAGAAVGRLPGPCPRAGTQVQGKQGRREGGHHTPAAEEPSTLSSRAAACCYGCYCQAHDWYLRIQLDKTTAGSTSSSTTATTSSSSSSSSHHYRDALLYLSGLPFSEAQELMRAYGKKLMNQLPDDTTAIIIALCIGRFPPLAATGR